MISTGGEGKISGRKRVRGKIGNPSTAAELKQYNMLDTSSGVTEFYKEVRIYGVYVREALDYAGVWRPIMLRWPPLGPAAGARIGKKIRIKYLRIKGYVATSPFLITQVRYRLVLYRVRQNIVDGTEVYNQAWLRSLYFQYLNPEESGQGGTSKLIQRSMVKNFYSSFFDPESMKAHDCKRRVLLKGLIKPSDDIGNFRVPEDPSAVVKIISLAGANADALTVGNQSGAIVRNAQFGLIGNNNNFLVGEYQLHNTTADLDTEINSKGFYPIDLTVNMNDNVDTWEYRYVLVFESDWGVGQNPNGYYDSAPESSNFFVSIIPQIYYTDD